MKRKLIWAVSAVAVMIFAVLLYTIVTKAYYPALPIDHLSKQTALKSLNSNQEGLVKLADEEQFSWYGYKGNQADGSRMLQLAMQERDWTFKEQEGAGYFFLDKDQQIKIVTSQMWTSSYVLYKVPNR